MEDSSGSPWKSYIALGLGIGILCFLFYKSKPKKIEQPIDLKSLADSYKYACNSFELVDKIKFKKFHDKLVKDVFKSFDLPTTKILTFENYVIGFCDRYIDKLAEYKDIKCNEVYSGIYYILCLDALKDLSNLLLYDKQKYINTIAPTYYGILVDKLNLSQSQIDMYTEDYIIYKEKGFILIT